MQNTTQKNNKRYFLLIMSALVGLFRIMPIFQGYFGVLGDMMVFILAILSLFPVRTKTLENMFGTLIVSVAFLYINTLTRTDSFLIDTINIARNAFIMVFAVYLCTEETIDKDIIRKLFWVSLIAISITQISSIVVVSEYPLAARLAIHGNRDLVSNVYDGINVARMNLSGYDIAYSLPIVTSLLYALIKSKKLKPIWFVLHIVLSLWFLFAVQFTLAILLYTSVLISLLVSNGKPRRTIVFAVIIFILVLLFQSALANLFAYLAETTDSQVLESRFSEISSFFSGRNSSDSDLNLRLSNYMDSLKTFIKNPFFGKILGIGKGGGHSAVLDYLAASGCFGLLFLVLAFRSVYKKTICKYKGIPYIGYIYLSQVCFFVFAFLNTAFRTPVYWVIFIMPIGACEIICQVNEDTKTLDKSKSVY